MSGKEEGGPCQGRPMEIPGWGNSGGHSSIPWPGDPRPGFNVLALSLGEYCRAVRRAVRDGVLTPPEGAALIATAECVFAQGADRVDVYRLLLSLVALSTTPERARALAQWTSFAPSAVLVASRAAMRKRAA